MKNKYIASGRVQQKLKTRDKILLVAQQFLSQSESFTLEDVARKASISRATIYRYYSSIDTLLVEASLALQTKDPDRLYNEFKNLDLLPFSQHTQQYFNNLSINHEQLFRKYLSLVLSTSQKEQKRGARRTRTLQLAFANKGYKLNDKQIENICNISTLFMGIEALVVMKDVCGLNNQDAKDTLSWGFDIFLEGAFKKLK